MHALLLGVLSLYRSSTLSSAAVAFVRFRSPFRLGMHDLFLFPLGAWREGWIHSSVSESVESDDANDVCEGGRFRQAAFHGRAH